MEDSLALDAITALARVLHRRGILKMDAYLLELETAAVGREQSGKEHRADELQHYIANLRAAFEDLRSVH